MTPGPGSRLSGVPTRVKIVEVGPRDGLQNESAIVPTADKLRFIHLLAEAGFEEIEVSSFVNPARVPQLADAEQVFASLYDATSPVRFSALVPNRRGMDRAIASRVNAVAFFTAASDSFTQKNIGMSVAESLGVFRSLIPDARAHGMRVRAYVSTAFVCPYEGTIAPETVAGTVRALVEMGVDEISIGDTIGHATPAQVDRLTGTLLTVLPVEKFAYHFHDTFGFALANVLMALQHGIAIFDSSAGGAGGCPFAPGAAGNAATEDLAAMLFGMGIDTGIDLEKLLAASRFLEAVLGRPLPSRILKARS